jgi:hypothetical protein
VTSDGKHATPARQLSLGVRRDQRAIIVVPTGEVDLASAPRLEAEIQHAWQSGAERLILDLRGVEFMDSTPTKADDGLASSTAAIKSTNSSASPTSSTTCRSLPHVTNCCSGH